MANCLDISSLPAPPRGRVGWPWDSSPSVSSDRDDGSWPRISIVTPSFNQGSFLEETIRSVLLQGYPNLEYIVMDGGSTDDSIELIRRYASHLDFWVSEKDRGQSHAINKGITHCTGELFNWINSDDLLTPGALWAVAAAWKQNKGAIVSGNTEVFGTDMPSEVVKARGQTLQNFVRFWEARNFNWTQPATFLPLAVLKEIGGVREDLRYCMDWHMMVRLLLKGSPVAYLDRTLTRFRIHGGSKTVGEAERFRLELVPTLRAMLDLPIKVEDWEWNREEARRLVDVAVRALRRGAVLPALKSFSKAVTKSPTVALSKVAGRAANRCGLRLGT